MTKKVLAFPGLFLITFVSHAIQAQTDLWLRLVPLESTRDDAEKILGKPEAKFETSGVYRNEIGKFTVWYSKGGCHSSVAGRQYDVPPQRFIGLIVYLARPLPLQFYVSDVSKFSKSASAFNDRRNLYTSADESTTYETVVPPNGNEFVYSISIEPSKDKLRFLCSAR